MREGSRAAELDAQGHLAYGSSVRGKTELVDLLRWWLTKSRAQTIGDVGTFGGKAWVFIDFGGRQAVLNADTKRVAIETCVRENGYDSDRPWSVIHNRRGRVNKVVPGPSPEPLFGWYCYLTEPMANPGEV